MYFAVGKIYGMYWSASPRREDIVVDYRGVACNTCWCTIRVTHTIISDQYFCYGFHAVYSISQRLRMCVSSLRSTFDPSTWSLSRIYIVIMHVVFILKLWYIWLIIMSHAYDAHIIFTSYIPNIYVTSFLAIMNRDIRIFSIVYFIEYVLLQYYWTCMS